MPIVHYYILLFQTEKSFFNMTTVTDIRNLLAENYKNGKFVISDSGVKTVEIIGASFIADDHIIFGVDDKEYVKREIQWYLSQSLYVNDIGDPVPKIWQRVSDKDGKINSNYGFLIGSVENGEQYKNVIHHLLEDKHTRRAVAIYTRPTMHVDFNRNGMSDFVCTNAVQYVIRDNALDVIVQMRSNDAWSGYKNDSIWQAYVATCVINDYNEQTNSSVELGRIHWQVGSLHLYEPQFYLLESYLLDGTYGISHKEWKEKNEKK